MAEALALAAVSPEAAGRIYNVSQPFVRTRRPTGPAPSSTLMGLDSEIVLVDPEAGGVLFRPGRSRATSTIR